MSPDQLLQRALPYAVQDRISFEDAYNNKGPEAQEAAQTRQRIQALTGVKFANMDEPQLRTAMLALIYAEQWEQSLADSQPGSVVEKRCRANVKLFRSLRHHVWGPTVYENLMATSGSVTVWPPGLESKKLFDDAGKVSRAELDRVAAETTRKLSGPPRKP